MNPAPGELVIVGAGPAGVSAAWALCERGIPVTMLDAGSDAIEPPPDGSYLDMRFSDPAQWRWQLGEDFSGLAAAANASPKLRVPRFVPMFEGYAEANRLHAEPGFELLGALAAGGLSNAWGCGVACFDAAELGDLVHDQAALRDAYERVATRTGLSGSSDDALRTYFGLDQWADPGVELDPLHAALWSRRDRLARDEAFRLGRARVAVLARDRPGRSACDLSGTCLWGCARKATWSATQELAALSRQPGFRLHPGTRVERLQPHPGGGFDILATDRAGRSRGFRAGKVLLGAGTIATTRLVLASLADPPPQVRLLSNPMAAFLLFLPGLLGTSRQPAFGLAQLSFVLGDVHAGEAAMGNLFSTMGLPVAEFLAHLPITRRSGLPLLRALLPATAVGNLFLPGSLSDHHASIDSQARLWIHGGASAGLDAAAVLARKSLQRGFRQLGGWILPGSFTQAAAGADIHYAGTLPISANPSRSHHCRMDGEVVGMPGVHVIDGAALPRLPAKAHTLTIMANADRIARALRVEP